MPKHKIKMNSAVFRLPEVRIMDPNSSTCHVFDLYLCNIAQIYKEGKENDALIGEHTPKEMLHTSVGLLSVSLVSMDKTTIYDALSEKSSVTLFFISRDEQVAANIISKNKFINDGGDNADEVNGKTKFIKKLRDALHSIGTTNLGDDDAYESSSEETTEFGLVFASDVSSESEEESVDDPEEEEEGADKEDAASESSETSADNDKAFAKENESESSEDDDEDDNKYSKGYHTFLSSCLQRKITVKELFFGSQSIKRKNMILPLLGPENRIAAACNFRVRKIGLKKRVIHITFLSVRRHLRRLGVGTRIMELVKSPNICGLYDAIVVHADLNATKFFSRNGFSADPLLNKQWAQIAGEYVNCTLMTYFPPMSFTKSLPSSTKTLQSIDEAIEDWLTKTGDVHQMQYMLCKQLRAEIVRLQTQLLSQDSLIRVLKCEMIKQTLQIDDFRIRLNGESLPTNQLRPSMQIPISLSRLPRNVPAKMSPFLEALNLELLPSPLTTEHGLTINMYEQIFTEPSGDGELED